MLYHKENKWKKRLIAFYDFGVILILIMCFISYGLKPLMNLFNLRIELKIYNSDLKSPPEINTVNCGFSIVDLEEGCGLEEIEFEEVELEEEEEIAEKFEEIILDLEEEVEDEKTEELFFCSLGNEQTATPIGGYKAFYKFISENLKYPEKAKINGIEGRVYIQFLVSKKGELTEIKTAKGIGYGCDKAAEEVIRKSPKWNPGEQRGIPVKQRVVIPINFKLK